MQSDTWNYTNWFNGKPEQRILNWRRYRHHISDNHLEHVATDWANCPVISNLLQPDDPTDWPDAWTLIGNGSYDDVGRALGMFYTLYYSDYRHRDDMVLKCYMDRKNHQYLNLLFCEQEKYMLNYSLGEVVNTTAIEPTAILLNTLTAKDIKI